MKTRLFLSLVLGWALTGCGGIGGTLSVQEMFNLKDRKGDTVQIPVGSHKVKLNYKENKNRLIVSFNELDGEKVSIEANTPEGFELPDNGPFSLKAADYGQEVDLNGHVTTVRTQSEMQRGRQSCQYTEWETVCYTNAHGQTVCNQRPVSRQGWQDIHYYDVTTDQTLTADFSKPETSANVAHVNAHSAYSERRVTYTGFCSRF